MRLNDLIHLWPCNLHFTGLFVKQIEGFTVPSRPRERNLHLVTCC
ncbi:hypothetical protein OIU78_011920 [Salix suchowensis]|nr:hypothetical protein OIU78_011920 [Salix suchowensis]